MQFLRTGPEVIEAIPGTRPAPFVEFYYSDVFRIGALRGVREQSGGKQVEGAPKTTWNVIIKETTFDISI